MENNIFAPAIDYQEPRSEKYSDVSVPDYSVCVAGTMFKIVSFLIGFAAGFAVLFIYYKIIPLSLVGGLIVGFVNIFAAERSSIKKRKLKLRVQFFDMLEAMSVSMRAGNPVLKALESARNDLLVLYPPDSDIVVELDIILAKFNNAVPISAAFADFAERSGLEDVQSFASIYSTIEGKSSRADEIVKETQQIISDKMEIEMEIETLMTSAKSEVYIMLFMPLVILGVIGYAGAGFMDAIYTTGAGRVVATFGFIVFCISFVLARKFSDVKL